MRCTYVSQNGTPCRAYARRGGTHCRHHGFRVLQLQGRAFRPSQLDAFLECPERCRLSYHTEEPEETGSRAALVGMVGHEILAESHRAYLRDGAWRVEPHDVSYLAAGRLTASEIEDIAHALEWYRPDYVPDEIVAIERTRGHGRDAEPVEDSLPAWYRGFLFWGTPDLVLERLDGTFEIRDWKFGRQPTDPHGAAPIAYTWLHWQKAGATMTWPVKIVWRWMRLGEDAGTRTLLLQREDVERGMEFWYGVARRIGESVRHGVWPAVPNEYCGFCAKLGECLRGPKERTVEEMARTYILECGEAKYAANRAEQLRVQLAQLVAAGEDIADPDTGDALFEVNLGTRHSHGRLTADTMPVIAEACREAGVHMADVLRLDGGRLQSKPRVLERLVEAGVSKRTDELTIRRASANGKAGVK